MRVACLTVVESETSLIRELKQAKAKYITDIYLLAVNFNVKQVISDSAVK